MSGTDDLPSLQDAMGTINGTPMFTEARRQYEALCKDSTERYSKNTAAGPLHLQQFYASRFDRATEHLDWEMKMKLLTICFAYKTQKRVLCFLDLVSPKVAWRNPLKQVVDQNGRDTLFPTVPTTKAASKPMHPSAIDNTAPTETDPAHGLRRTSAREPRKEDDVDALDSSDHFVIPTLPLAFPVHYLSAWASHIALPNLTAVALLNQPVAYCIAASNIVKNNLRLRLPDAYYSSCEDAPLRHRAFFEYLLQGTYKLPGVYAPDGAGDGVEEYPFEPTERGYSLSDMERWVEVWKEERMRRLGGKSTQTTQSDQVNGGSRARGKRKRAEGGSEVGVKETKADKRVRFAKRVETSDVPRAGPKGGDYAAFRAPAQCDEADDGKPVPRKRGRPLGSRKNVNGAGKLKTST